jgi:site-specific recombinase XerD
VHDLQDELSPHSVKQHLAAIRMLFDWLVTRHVIDTNRAHSVRGPCYAVKKGKTPVLTPEEAHALSIEPRSGMAEILHRRAKE